MKAHVAVLTKETALNINATRLMEVTMGNIIVALAILVIAAIAIFKINNKTNL
jgi:hypothetical protein